MLKGESFQPWLTKIGPSKNGLYANATPARCAHSSTRISAGYEYVLANSNQTSTVAMVGFLARH
jgi:hypothetical protein